MSGRRWLYLTHRWLGIVLCLFMALWFVSGVVMMYVGYPKLTEAERLAHLPELRLPADCCITPHQAISAAIEVAQPARGSDRRQRPDDDIDLRLAMIGATPHWLVAGAGRAVTAVDALTGRGVGGVDADRALAAARAFAPSASPRWLDCDRQDFFTVSRALDPHRPLHRFALDDNDGTELYVSSRTGEVVRDSTRMERGWNWLGAIVHWLYPFRGEFFDPLRADIIIYLSLAGTVLAIVGVVIGLLRWRIVGRYANGLATPYRPGWMRWHHIAGLAFGLVTLTWIFSGLLSMNPWRVFDTDGPRPDRKLLAGLSWSEARFARSPADAAGIAPFPVRELAVRLFSGRAHYIAFAASGRSLIVPADGAAPMERFPDQAVESLAHRLMPGHAVTALSWLRQYDNYYYQRSPHTMTGHAEKRLPMLRVEYDDTHATWLHLDPYTGRIQNRIDDVGRIRRWLFAFLHSFDAQGFVDHRPLWDITLITLSIGGFVLCASGAVIGWRRLRRPGTHRPSTLSERPRVRR